MQFFSVLDLILVPIWLAVITILALWYKSVKIQTNPVYRYFFPALLVKILGATAFCLVYTLYYAGGDTLNYFSDSVILVDSLFQCPSCFFTILFGDNSVEVYQNFSPKTGYPVYWDSQDAYHVVKLVWPFVLLGGKSYLASSILLSSASFLCLWKVYLVFTEEFKGLYFLLVVAILLMPSTVFWGSGMLKDSITISLLSLAFWSIREWLVKSNGRLLFVIILIFSAYHILRIKPYIFISFAPIALFWTSRAKIRKIKHALLRVLIGPSIVMVAAGLSIGLWLLFSKYLGQYSSVDSILLKASVSQKDLKRDYYKGNSFDIGEFEPTFSGVASKFVPASVAGLFRPAIWEANNVVMLAAGVENLILTLFAIIVLVKIRTFWKLLMRYPILQFCLLFSVFFAFGIGISTSNFGALVRFKIPLLPFFTVLMVVTVFSGWVLDATETDKYKSQEGV